MNDSHFISKAASLALKGKFNTKPGVNVGCVIVKNNKIIGQGFYEKYGGSHAEIKAINEVKRKYKTSYLSRLSGSDIYISLEPCSTKGKTGACVNEIKKYDFKRIVIGAKDPSQNGIKNLQRAGYEVINMKDQRCIALNESFFHKAKFKKPFIRAKVAMSSDHKSVFTSKQRKWITGIPARNDVQKLRAEADIILTGAGTINEDSPSMNVRAKKIISNKNFVQPARYVFSNGLKLNWTAPFFKLPGQKVVVTSIKNLPKLPQGVKDVSLMNLKNKNSINPKDFVKKISKLNINNILIEAGPKLLGSFGDCNLIDEYIFYISKEKLGERALYFYGGRKQLNFFDNKLFDIVEEKIIGKDKKIILRKK
ncbi:bifunctional diaminohydroxyphosphoribosylaminopyrimidine deaminase/5-amino-6-(5-phosphoribosylamino)uracil reductase RibD [Gammaproteobacteria bacterium]|nr:bifunctional diaminohydroxyphosphoribosylaminopyrimidine deaminase/5-amino-6-(5-phosphoribosylamino)uracil reductase RibD [Gammaproteobacteria bacterium]